MPKYRVIIEQTILHEVTVEAENEEAAETLVHEGMLDFFNTSPDDVDGIDFLGAQEGTVYIAD